MARNATSDRCLCRVPLSEAAVPMFGRDSEMHQWLAARGVELAPDHVGRPSIALADAYRLKAEADEAVEVDRVERARRAEKLAAEASKAQRRRQATFDRAIVQAGTSVHPQTALLAAWEAVHESERGLDTEIRAMLSGVAYDADGALGRHLGTLTAAGA